MDKIRVLIPGGGVGGLYAALQFEKRKDPRFEVTLVNCENSIFVRAHGASLYIWCDRAEAGSLDNLEFCRSRRSNGSTSRPPQSASS